jgi:hypothetical protein
MGQSCEVCHSHSITKEGLFSDTEYPGYGTFWPYLMAQADSEKAELFRKIEPYLTFLNVHQLERQGTDIQSKAEELEELNHSLS